MSDCLTPPEVEALLAGGLSSREKDRAEAHVAGCERCRRAVDQARADGDLADKIKRAYREETASSPDDSPEGGREHSDETFGLPGGERPQRRLASSTVHIEGYQILGVLGKGGMGIVYEATQTALDRKVALKVLPAILGTASSDAVARFRREATAAAKLHHTNIVPVYDYGESPDGYYYAMELIDGEPLNQVIHKLAAFDVAEASAAQLAEVLVGGPHPEVVPDDASDIEGRAANHDQPFTGKDHGADSSSSSTRRGRAYFQQVARWMADVALALDYAHGQRVIHRDIKPSNLILSRDGRLMIADFGLAMLPDEKSLTMTGSLLGTLRYMSPEQAMAKRLRVDHRTDVYSLGVTMYELLTFQPAYQGRDEKEILSKIITLDPAAPRKLNPSVPRELDTICLKCMEKPVAARYDTAGDFAADLQRYIDDVPIVARPPGPLTRSIKFVRRHRTKSVATVAVVLLALVGSFALSQRQATREKDAKLVETEVERLKGLGSDAVIGQRWDEAEAAFAGALKLDPDNARAMFMQAWSRQRQADVVDEAEAQRLLGEADTLCRQGRGLDLTDFWGLNIHGVILKKLERFDDAIDAYEKAVELNPDDYAPHVNLGTMHALIGELQSAQEQLTRATELARAQGRHEPKAVDAWRNLACLQLHLKQDAAAQTIKEAIEWEREAASYMIRARLRLQLDGHVDVRQALLDANTADELSTRPDPRIKRIYALGHLRNSEFDRAVGFANEAIELGDRPAINHLIIAIAQAHLGHIASAREHLETAGAEWPEDFDDTGTLATAPDGVLWFETADELDRLRQEAEQAIASKSP